MKLYKYVTIDRLDVLENLMIRFTQPDGLNDPFDLNIVVEKLIPEKMFSTIMGDIATSMDDGTFVESSLPELRQRLLSEMKLPPKQLKALENNEEFNNILDKNFGGLLQTVVDKSQAAKILRGSNEPLSIEKKNEIVSDLFSQHGILSLTETPDNSLMWSHYAYAHKGFIIEFDANHSFFNFPKKQKSALLKVQYVEQTKQQSFIPDGEVGDPRQAFALKSLEWNYEKEHRLVKKLEDADKVLNFEEKIYLFAIPQEIITGIIFGAKISEENKQKIIEVIKNNPGYENINFSQEQLNIKENSISINPIKNL